jgi:uncharacterized repeat protein (TIGR02543 family)
MDRYTARAVWPIIFSFIIGFALALPEAHALLAKPPATGQTTSYAARDDGALTPGVPWPAPRFIDSGNGTVTDNLTGLIWLKNADCTETVGGVVKTGGLLTWADALSWSNSLADGSCNLADGSNAADWRLPGRRELESVVDMSKNGPALPAGHPFSNVMSSYYWTATTFSDNTGYAWGVYLGDSYADGNVKSSRFHVWPVRGGQFGTAVSAVAPAAEGYGNVPVGGSSSRTVTVSNTAASGSSRLQINAIALRGSDPGQFSIDPGTGSDGSCGTLLPILDPGTSCSIAVSYNPTALGPKNATLRISASDLNAPNSEVSLSGTGTGYAVTASISGGNGTISSTNPLILAGGPATFTLAPDATYQPASSVSGTCPAGSWNGSQYTTGAVIADCTVIFSFSRITYPLTITFAGTGGDRVSVLPAPPAVDCSGDCSQTFEINTIVTLSAAAAAGYTFTGWSGACSSSGSCLVTMTGALSVTAAFADLTPPLVSIVSPVAALTNNRTPQLTYSVSDGSVSVKLDGTLISINNNDNLPSLADGSHTLVVEATDAAANTGTDSVTFDVDGTTPVISTTAPANNSFINIGRVGYTLSEAVAEGAITFTRSGGATDPSSPRVYSFITPDLTAGSHVIDAIPLQNGTVYDIAVTAHDAAGNSAVPASVSAVAFDATAAAAAIAAPLPGIRTNSASVTYTLSEPLASAAISFSRSSGSADPVLHRLDLTGADLQAGEHLVATGFSLVDGAVYRVSIDMLTDLAGNTTPAVAADGVTYDITALPAGLNSPVAGSIITDSRAGFSLGEAAQSASITFTNTGGITDPGSPRTYAISSDDLAGGSHMVTTGLSLVNGAVYTVSLAAVDLAGNPATIVSVTNVTFADRFTLTVQKAGLGSGLVKAQAGTGTGINCGSQCSETYLYNTLVSLAAETDVSSLFTGWSGACSGTADCLVTIDGMKSVTATFADITPPDTAITSGPADPATSNSFTFTFTATEAGSTFECRTGGGDWSACASPYSSSLVYAACGTCRADSRLSFAVRAQDQTGNYDPAPASYNWTISHLLSTPVDAVLDGGTVQLPATDISADLIISREISFTLKGGYSADYLTQTGTTTIHGSITIITGSVTVDGITIQ